MFNDALDRTILSRRVTALEDHQHLVAVLDDVPLNLDQLDLQPAQRRFVSRATI
jgi:hypothetical protein